MKTTPDLVQLRNELDEAKLAIRLARNLWFALGTADALVRLERAEARADKIRWRMNDAIKEAVR